jgi:hypothetical protein
MKYIDIISDVYLVVKKKTPRYFEGFCFYLFVSKRKIKTSPAAIDTAEDIYNSLRNLLGLVLENLYRR